MFCDMKFVGGGWVLVSYGYVFIIGMYVNNKVIFNMNNFFGFVWLFNKCRFLNGFINLLYGVLKMVINVNYMIMVGGNNLILGGIE